MHYCAYESSNHKVDNAISGFKGNHGKSNLGKKIVNRTTLVLYR